MHDQVSENSAVIVAWCGVGSHAQMLFGSSPIGGLKETEILKLSFLVKD
jgi:hypothetical protein